MAANKEQTKEKSAGELLAEKLCEAYDVTPDEAKADVAEIIADWQKVDVVE